MRVDELERLVVRKLARNAPRDPHELVVALEGSRRNKPIHEARGTLEEGSNLRTGGFPRQAVEVLHLRKLVGPRLPLRRIQLKLDQVPHRDAVLAVDACHLRLELAIAVDRTLVYTSDVHAPPQVEA